MKHSLSILGLVLVSVSPMAAGQEKFAESFSPASIPVGGASTLKLTLTNPPGTAITLTENFIDTLPSGLSIGQSSFVDTCGDELEFEPGGTSFEMDVETIFTSCEVDLPITATQPGIYTNSIPAGAIVTDHGSNAALTASLTVTAMPPTAAIQFDPASVSVGGTSTLTLTLGNPNSVSITLTSDLIDGLPAGLAIANPLSIGGTCAGTVSTSSGTVSLQSASSIPPGGCTVVAAVMASAAGNLINTIPTGSMQTTAGNNSTPATAALVASPAVSSTTLATPCESTFVANQLFTTIGVVSGFNPSGDVTFSDGGISIDECAGVSLTSDVAICSSSSLQIGIHNLTASYGGDTNNQTSGSSPLVILVLDPADVILRNGFEGDIAECPSM